MGQTASDFSCVPLCRLHHTEQTRMGKVRFQDKYGICFRDIIARLTQKPRIQIVNGNYVAVLEGMPQESYLVGPVRIGRKEAIRKAVEFFKEQYIDVQSGRKPAGSLTGRQTGVVAAGGEWPWLVE